MLQRPSTHPAENGVPVSFLLAAVEWPPCHPTRVSEIPVILFLPVPAPPAPILPLFYLPSDLTDLWPVLSTTSRERAKTTRHLVRPRTYTYLRPGNLLAANSKTYSEWVLLSTTSAISIFPPTGANRTAGLARVLLAAEGHCSAAPHDSLSQTDRQERGYGAHRPPVRQFGIAKGEVTKEDAVGDARCRTAVPAQSPVFRTDSQRERAEPVASSPPSHAKGPLIRGLLHTNFCHRLQSPSHRARSPGLFWSDGPGHGQRRRGQDARQLGIAK